MLRIELHDGESARILEFQDRPLLAGSDPSCEILLPGPEIPSRFLALKPSGRGSWKCKVLEGEVSRNGVAFKEGPLGRGDLLRAGGWTLKVLEISGSAGRGGSSGKDHSETTPRGKGRWSLGSYLSAALVLLGLTAATLAYLHYGRGPSDLELRRVEACLEKWDLARAGELLEGLRRKEGGKGLERIGRELEAYKAAWREAERIYASIWDRRRVMPEGKMIEALRQAEDEALSEGKTLTARALRWKLSNLHEALLADLGDPSGKRAARFREEEKARVATAEVVERVDRLLAEDRYTAALQLLDQARAEASSPGVAEDYASKRRAVLNTLRKKAWAALSRAYRLADAGMADDALALLRKTLSSFPPDPSLIRLKWKLKGAESEILPLCSSAGGEAKPTAGKPGERALPGWGSVAGGKPSLGTGESRPGRAVSPAKKEGETSRGTGPSPGSGGETLTLSKLLARAAEVERKWRFHEAADLLGRAAALDPGVAERAEEDRFRAAYMDALIAAIRKNPAAFRGIRVEDGGRADLLGADRDGVDALLDGDRERVGWPLLGPATLVRLGSRFQSSMAAEARLGRALLAWTAGLKDLFARSLKAASAQDPSLGPKIQEILARFTGKKGPFAWMEGRWIPLAEKETILKTRAAEKEAERALGARDFQGKAAALEKLAARGEIEKEAALRVLERLVEKDARRLSKDPFFGRLQKVAALRQELDKRRKYALDLIFDKDKYFYPFKPPACPPEKAKKYWPVQQEVDKRVAAVREIWDKKVSLPIPPSVRRLALEASWALKEMEALGSPDPGAEESLVFALRLPLKEGVVTVRNFAWTMRERRRLDMDRRILRYNMVADVDATKAEMAQMNITNDYRMMMGRRALAVNQKLLRAARAHSKEMADLGYFSHFSPTKGLRTPFMRMAREGYSKGVSENIARVAGPEGAHVAWLHSSGHHRNILNPGHTEFATGNWGIYWTQCFGQGQDYLKDPLFEKE